MFFCDHPALRGFFIFAVGVTALFASFTSKAAQNSPILVKATDALSSALCRGQYQYSDLWKIGEFHSQISGRFFESTESKSKKVLKQSSLDRSAIFKRARIIAEAATAKSYSVGFCPDGRAWMVQFRTQQSIELQPGMIRMHGEDHCEGTLTSTFVEETGLLSQKLKRLGPSFVVPKDKKGYVSIECSYLESVDRGSEEWFLFPINGAMGGLPENLRFDLRKHKDIFGWLQSVRRSLGLLVPTLDERLSESARQLAVGFDIRHNKSQLKKVHQDLLKENVLLIGENRVRGESLQELAELLWMSPRHRDLLLDAELNKMGLSVQQDGKGYFAVMLGSKKKP
jgi:hypothetical protein